MPEPKRILVVGGVAGGASAATRARRLSEDAEIVLFERGPYVSFANCGLPYHIGGAIQDRKRLLVQTPEGLYARYDIDVRVNTEVVAIDRQAREVVAKDLRKGREYRQPYDALVLSPGAEPIRPPIPGIEDPYVFILRNIRDMDAIPTHLLSREAMRLYLSKLDGQGVVAFHITNRFMNLIPLVANLAKDAGLVCRVRSEQWGAARLARNMERGYCPADVAAVARKEQDLGKLAKDQRWRAASGNPNVPIWTDRYSDIVGLVLFRP